MVQELEEAALKVLEEQQRIQALFEEKTEALAVITAEYEAKKKDVRSLHKIEEAVLMPCEASLHADGPLLL